MKSIRHSSFETNSSSSHSISIALRGDAFNHDLHIPVVKFYTDSTGYTRENCVVFTGGEFGWEIESYNDAITKANYVAVALGGGESRDVDHPHVKLFERVIMNMTGATSVVYDFSEWSYIDHQSDNVAFAALTDEETLKSFIFDPDSTLHTDNDNDY